MLRPTPGDPWGAEKHQWNTGAKEFSLDPPLPVVVNKKIVITTAERLFLSRGILKKCNKDDMALKTSTKMVVYTNKCICPGNI